MYFSSSNIAGPTVIVFLNTAYLLDGPETVCLWEYGELPLSHSFKKWSSWMIGFLWKPKYISRTFYFSYFGVGEIFWNCLTTYPASGWARSFLPPSSTPALRVRILLNWNSRRLSGCIRKAVRVLKTPAALCSSSCLSAALWSLLQIACSVAYRQTAVDWRR